jgi:peptidoglycan/xylan/chitin deacetylase (PgdA/CDA1 family)
MGRLADHWRTLEVLDRAIPEGATGESAGCPPPERAVFRGIPVWVHPLARPPGDHRFVTDGGDAFLPDDAIANVHLERYVEKDGGSLRTEVLKRGYYILRPVMPRSVQLAAQRVNARSRLASVEFPAWPHDDSLHRFLGAALGVLLEKLGRERVPFLGFWPGRARWAACFTHDVELAPGLRAMDRFAAIEEAAGIRSTWFIVPERYPVSPADFRGLAERGHEIGVHGLNHDGRLFSSRALFTERAEKIGRYARAWGAVGFRSPSLYRNPDWMPELGFRYDSSFMDTAVLEPQLGGVSTVHPFHLGELVELPITMPMDHHLINLLRTDVVDGMLAKFRWVVERHGLANFLFHPDYNLEERRLADYGKIVEEVVRTGGGWIATAAEIADWWNRRRRSRVAESGQGVRIEGPAARDGSVWWVARDGDGMRISPNGADL